MKNKLFLRGAILGILFPFLGFILYSSVELDGDFIAFYYQLKVMEIHTHVMSLCVLLNLLPFLIFIKTQRSIPARGVLMSTIIFALIIMFIRIT